MQSEIKPNLTAVGQVWALTEGQTKTGAWGPFAILSVPRNPRNELSWVVAIPRNRELHICNPYDCDWILDFWQSWCNSGGLHTDWTQIVSTPISPGFRSEASGRNPDPRLLPGEWGSSAILLIPCNLRISQRLVLLTMAVWIWPVEQTERNRGGSKVVVYGAVPGFLPRDCKECKINFFGLRQKMQSHRNRRIYGGLPQHLPLEANVHPHTQKPNILTKRHHYSCPYP